MRNLLLLAALGLLLAPAVQAQDWQLDPTFGSVELEEGFLPDPHEITLTAGGGSTPAVSGCDYGYIAEAPDYDLYYEASGGSTLYIYAVSGSDTTILVNTPDQSWVCDDDSYGDGDPLVIVPNAEGGLYDIWVGTYGEDAAEATLFISEVDPR
ncbi:MAG: hypothetical protein R3181_10850 [Rubricoccaceae bacterium]|nr:hypothetical protein [Rubricoccaceae bacterium]